MRAMKDNEVARMSEEDKSALERAAELAAVEQADQLAEAFAKVGRLDALERQRVSLSARLARHNGMLERTGRGSMAVEEIEEVGAQLKEIVAEKVALSGELLGDSELDSRPCEGAVEYRKLIATVPELGGEPWVRAPPADATHEQRLRAYGFDPSEEEGQFLPASRPVSYSSSVRTTPRKAAEPASPIDRTSEELWANERAARATIDDWGPRSHNFNRDATLAILRDLAVSLSVTGSQLGDSELDGGSMPIEVVREAIRSFNEKASAALVAVESLARADRKAEADLSRAREDLAKANALVDSIKEQIDGWGDGLTLVDGKLTIAE